MGFHHIDTQINCESKRIICILFFFYLIAECPNGGLLSFFCIELNQINGFEITGPGTVFCDNMNLLFMFLSIATSNMVASSLAKQVSFLYILRI